MDGTHDDQSTERLTKEKCMEFLDKLIAEGVNPNRLSAVRDDVQTSS